MGLLTKVVVGTSAASSAPASGRALYRHIMRYSNNYPVSYMFVADYKTIRVGLVISWRDSSCACTWT